MFRDLKEYQEIAKIYAEKVSKPAEAKSDELVENQENRRKLTQSRTIQNQGRVEKQFGFLKPKPRNLKDGQTSVRQSGVNDPRRKKIETNKEPEYKPVPGVVFGQRTNEVGALGDGKPSEGDFKKDFPNKDKEVKVSNLTKQGKERTPAQIAAAKRIASGKTIQQVKDENLQSIKNKAKLKNTDFQAMKKGDMSKDDFVKKYPNSNLAKKMKEGYELDERELAEKMNINPGSGRDTVNEPGVLKVYRNIRTVGNLIPNIGKALAGDKDAFKKMEKKEVERYKNPKGIERVATGIADKITGDKFDFDMRGKSKTKNTKADVKSSYEYDAYDLVLEYLLSSEQAATIEEANYVMTEMDAETIQGIVEEQKKNFDEGAGVAAAALAGGLLTYGLYKRNQYKKDAEKRDEKTNFGKIQKATDAKNKLLKDAGMGGN